MEKHKHTHLHIIPRFSGDGFTHWHGARWYDGGEIANVAQKIISMLSEFL